MVPGDQIYSASARIELVPEWTESVDHKETGASRESEDKVADRIG